ncbi:MAG: hypothetical protein V2J12_08540 [Gammaproteobacteria bacterium]|jgi:hypothetical protein|nr:hypothetical protein [Gammaproteobacteria bacterium]
MQLFKNNKQTISTVVLVAMLSMVFAAPVRADVPSWFWNAVVDFFGNTNSRLAALESTVAQQQAYISLLESYIEVDETTNPARPTVRIVAANLQVVNGEGSTSTINGLGNIIVGYDELRGNVRVRCSNGAYLSFDSCVAAGYVWGDRFKTGSHNLVVGAQNNYGSYGGIVAGYRNIINREFASVPGGRDNVASGLYSSVSGGRDNGASGLYSVVSGGFSNTASAQEAVVSGGRINTASGSQSVVSGGQNNTASGTYSVVSAGNANDASGETSVVSGGTGNLASGVRSAVSGGASNTASGPRSVVSGGNSNDATAETSVVSGGLRNEASGTWSSVSGGADRTSSGEADWRAGTLFENF